MSILGARITSYITHVATAPTSLFINTNLNQDIPIPLGIFIGLLASFVQSLGLAVQRRSHVHNSQLPEQDQKVEHRRPLWLIGFAIFLTSNVFGSFIQIASLPVVILAPLGAVSLLWNALFARLLLRPRMLLGTALIAGGAALIAIYGIVPETTRSLDELMALFARPAFIIWFCAEGFILLVCLVVTHGIEYSYKRQLEAAAYSLLQANRDSPLSSSCTSAHDSPLNSPTPLPPICAQQPSIPSTGLTEEQVNGSFASEVTPLLDPKYGRLSSTKSALPNSKFSSLVHVQLPGRTPLLLALAYAAASGTLSGLCLIFAKSGVELLVLTFGGVNQFFRWEAWILVGGLIIFALGQLWYLNRGLRLADPAFVCPSAFCFYNFSSIINGLVYFDQLGPAGMEQWLMEYWFDDKGASLASKTLSEDEWLLDNEHNSLAMWLFWLFLRPDRFERTERNYRTFATVLKPTALAANKYNICHAPWEDFVPRSCLLEPTLVNHYSNTYQLTPPTMAIPAILSYISLVGPLVGPTRINYKGPHAPISFPSSESLNQSLEWEADWQRCMNLAENPLASQFSGAYKVGSLQGVWEGVFTYTEFTTYAALLSGRSPSILHNCMVAQHRQTWKLREYHLTVSRGTDGIAGGAKSPSLGSGDPLKAFFPSGIRIHEHAGTAEVHEPGKTAPLTYGQPSACGVENKGFECPEIQDIIVIGEGHSAWGQFNVIGRVRPCDGFVSLLKEYAEGDRGQWLYRGYLVGGINGSLSGRWRDTLSVPNANGYEGCFVMSRRR